MIECLISFGSNLGESRQIVMDAASILDSHPQISNLVVSELLQTRPIGGPEDQPSFVNGAIRFQTGLDSANLLQLLHETERDFGRQRRIRWDSRVLDLDLLLFGQQIISEPECEIPHPRMSFRRFVLQPAVSIAGEMLHPVCHASIGELLECVEQRDRNILIFASASRQSAIADQLNQRELKTNLIYCDFEECESIYGSIDSIVLMVFDLRQQEKKTFIQQSRELLSQHRGPVLILKDESIDQVATEVLAAIETMKAL